MSIHIRRWRIPVCHQETYHDIVEDQHPIVRPEADAVDQGGAVLPDERGGVLMPLFCRWVEFDSGQ